MRDKHDGVVKIHVAESKMCMLPSNCYSIVCSSVFPGAAKDRTHLSITPVDRAVDFSLTATKSASISFRP